MKPFEIEELTDHELSQMLATWTVTVPSEDLRARIFLNRRIFWQPSFLTPSDIALPWYKSLFNGGRRSSSFAAALVLQVCAVAFCFVAAAPPIIRVIAAKSSAIFLLPYRSKAPIAAQKAGGGGGGGGQQASSPIARGEAPRFAHKAFIPPAMAVPKPVLPVVPTISAIAPQIEASIYGDPLSKITGISPGQGINGLGDGQGGGLGPGGGTGYRTGVGDGSNGRAYTIGGEVSAPVLTSKVEPEYSEEARKAKYSGVVLLTVIVDENGVPRNIRVVRPLGLGLDEKAIEAVQRWRFRPGLRHGKPVPVEAVVEVSFRLL